MITFPGSVGRVEVSITSSNNEVISGTWKPICGDGWGVKEAMVKEVFTLRNDPLQNKYIIVKLFIKTPKLKIICHVLLGGVSGIRITFCTGRNSDGYV